MFLKRVYSEICVIRVQIFILVSLLCEFVTFRRKKGLDGKILCGNLWANSLLWNKVEFESACIILVCGKGESIFIVGRIANKTQFLRPNRCVAAEAEISVQQLRALEKGQRNLGVDHLGRLSDAMGVSSDFLLKGCSENSTLVCKMLDDLKKKLQPSKQIAEKWAVLLLKQYVLVLYSDENTCYNIAMAQVSVAQEGKLPEMH